MIDSLFIIAELDNKDIKKVDLRERKQMKNIKNYLN
jgi:hypothetical protein